MKNIILILMVVFAVTSCTPQGNIESAYLDRLIKSEEFSFMAERAHPTDYDVIKVMNSFPNTSASRMLNLSAGYSIKFKEKSMEVNLPYFGRVHNPTMDTEKQGFHFTSKDYTFTTTQGKKGSYIITAKPSDIRNVSAVIFEIYKNGKAYVSISAIDRNPISYDGYIETNKK